MSAERRQQRAASPDPLVRMKPAADILLLAGVAALLLGAIPRQAPPAPPPTPLAQPQPRGIGLPLAGPTDTRLLAPVLKSSGCVMASGLPDHACTPGVVLAAATKEAICRPGYAKSVRLVDPALKRTIYSAYGLPATGHQPGAYEVDHLVSLELGGANDRANLWPEPATWPDGSAGFHVKDQVENAAHASLCAGQLDLAVVQYRIATDWISLGRDLQVLPPS